MGNGCTSIVSSFVIKHEFLSLLWQCAVSVYVLPQHRHSLVFLTVRIPRMRSIMLATSSRSIPGLFGLLWLKGGGCGAAKAGQDGGLNRIGVQVGRDRAIERCWCYKV